jgi:hypothetical protein
MPDKISGAKETPLVCSIAIFAAAVLGCALPPSLTRSDPPPAAAASPSPSPPTPTPTRAMPNNEETEAKENAFEGKEKEFRKLPAKVQLTAQPYIRGKAAFYSNDVELGEDTYWMLDNVLSGVFSSFDVKIKDVTAQAPDEVETVVLRNCRQARKGSYRIYTKETDSTIKTVPAYIWRCELTIVDRTLSAVIHRKKFESKLDKNISASGYESEVDAGIPYDEIYNFLGELPRK